MADTPWLVTESPWEPAQNQLWESRFTTGNGYLGIRGFPEEPFDAGPSLVGTYIAGVYEPDADGIPELVNVTNFFHLDIQLDDHHVRLAPERVADYSRTLDLRRGLLQRELVYTHGDRETRLQFDRAACMQDPHLACQLLEVTPLNWWGAVTVTFWLDATVRNQGKPHLELLHSRHVARDRMLVVTRTREELIRIGHGCRTEAWVRQDRPPQAEPVGSGARLGLRYRAQLEPCMRARFARTVATATSRDPDVVSVERSCLDPLRDSATWQPGVLRRRHASAWRRRWRNLDIAIDGPEEDQRAIRFATFHLVQAASTFDSTVSIGAKALSGEAYRGHVFWDTEIFILPFFVYTNPTTARRLLEYRRHTLPGARKKAAENGYEGAMFAWESAATGEETCPLHVPDPKTGEPVPVWCGRIEQHITADVVHGAWHYWQATGNKRFCDRFLTPLAVETARFWASRVQREGDEYVIRDVIGPDEYHEHVDNNAFTNSMAAWTLRLAAQLAPKDPDAEHWTAIADALRVPYDQELGIIAQDDGFLDLEEADPRKLSARVSQEPEKQRMARIWKSQVLKQADVIMLLMLWPDAFSQRLKQDCWRYYEPRTTHDSSLSASAHAIVAADLGLRRAAYRYFRLTAATDLDNPQGNTDQGLHAAALGGTWQAVVRGFLGIRTDGEELRINPHLPRQWQGVTLEVRHRGSRLALKVSRESLRVEKLSGRSPSTLRVGHRTHQLWLHEAVSIPL